MTASPIKRLLSPMLLAAFAAAGFILFVEAARIVANEPESPALALLGQEAPVPEELGTRPWVKLVATRALGSLKPFLLAWGAALLTGIAWGLGFAPWEQRGVFRLLAFPFQLLGCVPGFWFATVAAAFVFFHWDRPGYADEVSVAAGVDLVSWWNAAVVALPAAAAVIASHLRRIGAACADAARTPMARGLRLAGVPEERIQFRYFFRVQWGEYLRLTDHGLAPLIGILVFSEWALRYEGLGSLLVDCARLGAWPGVLAAGLVIVAFASLVTLLRETAEAILKVGQVERTPRT